MACQDVEVTVSCRVVCRPALQHHHPKQTNKQNAQDDINIQNGYFDLWPQTWRQHQPDLPKIRGSFHTNLGKCPPKITKTKTNRIISADTYLVYKNVSQWIYYPFIYPCFSNQLYMNNYFQGTWWQKMGKVGMEWWTRRIYQRFSVLIYTEPKTKPRFGPGCKGLLIGERDPFSNQQKEPDT